MDRCALFVDAGYLLADGAMAVHGTRRRESVTWDYEGLLQLLASLARDRTGLPLLRCYWYEATVEGRRTAEHEALADMPGIKLRLAKMRPGRREGVETEIHRDLTTLARNGAVSDAVVVSAEEDLAQVVADVQDLGMRVTIVHVTVDGNWTISRSLRQECDDIMELTSAHLRPYAELIPGAESARPEEQYPGGTPYGLRGRAVSNGHSAGGPVSVQALPAGSGPVGQPGHMAPPSIYTAPVVAEYQRPAPFSLPPQGDPVPAAADEPASPPGSPLAFGPPGPSHAGESGHQGPVRGDPMRSGHASHTGAMPQAPARAEFGSGGFMPAGEAESPAAGAHGPAGPAGPADPGHGVPAAQVPQGNAEAADARPRGREGYAAPVSMPFRGPPGPGDGGRGQAGTAGLPSRAGPASSRGSRENTQDREASPHAAPGPQASGAYQGQGPAGQPPAGTGRQGPADYTGRARGSPGSAYSAVGAHGDLGQFRTGGGGGHERPGGRQAEDTGIPFQSSQLPRRSPPSPSGAAGSAHGGPEAHGAQRPAGAHHARGAQDLRDVQGAQPYGSPQTGPYSGPQPAAPVGRRGTPPPAAPVSLADAVQSAHAEGEEFGDVVARDAPALWLEAVLARKPRMPSDLEARLLQGSALPIDFLLHDEVRHALRRGFWDALERAARR